MRHLQHEMRTPLGQIIGYSELLQEEAEESGRREMVPDLERIRGAALQLLSLVDELLGGGGAELEPPQRASEPEAATARGAAAAPAGGGAGRILVVDDDERNRDLLARRLERAGHGVEAVGDGRAALRRLGEERFDLVLLDVLMPGMSGLEVLEAIRGDHPRAALPVILATALDGSAHVVEGLRLGASDHVTKPFDFPVVIARVEAQLNLKRANDEIESLARTLEIRNAFIRRIFGRYVSDEVVSTLLEDPHALDLSGESREVTVVMADLRGFSSLTAERSPTEVLAVLNNYLGSMSEVIQRHEGVIDDFFGDGILAFFGAPVACEDHALRAVRCALTMQLALESVNRENQRQGLPAIEMGIGVATGSVIVGSMGSEARSKYGAIGLPVNLASRIESCSLGGEILIDDATLEAAGEALRIDTTREVHPKGFDTALRIHRVIGLRGEPGLAVRKRGIRWVALPSAISIEVSVLEGKQVGDRISSAHLQSLSTSGAQIECAEPIAEMSDVRLVFLDDADDGLRGVCYAKVVSGSSPDRSTLTVRFTARPTALIEQMRRAIELASL